MMTKAEAKRFAEWMAVRRCGRSIIGFPCTRPKKHAGSCGYNSKKFDWLVARWKETTR